MAYNNGFPMNYPQMYYQPQYQTSAIQQPQQPTIPTNNGIIWVQGEAGAKSYLVAPNNTVQLWDSEEQVIYLKSADASGMPSMKVLDYTIRNANPSSAVPTAVQSEDKYVTKEELKAFQEAVERRLQTLSERGTDNE